MSEAAAREAWETEILYPHRWGGSDARAEEEWARLRSLWDAAQPVEEATRAIARHICQISVCNWALEHMVSSLCKAIGTGHSTGLPWGHPGSITAERWKQTWAYYLTLRKWLTKVTPGGYPSLLRICDPSGEVAKHVLEMLGERTELKELYVERFCLCLDWCAVGGLFGCETALGVSHAGAIAAVEKRIKELDPDGDILPWIAADGDGALEPCHHKAFRRYDIIISSIGAGKWRAAMPERGKDGFERAEMHDRLISPIDAWLTGRSAPDGQYAEIHQALGTPSPTKVFLASLLVSLLRAQRKDAWDHAAQKG